MEKVSILRTSGANGSLEVIPAHLYKVSARAGPLQTADFVNMWDNMENQETANGAVTLVCKSIHGGGLILTLQKCIGLTFGEILRF